MKPVLLFVALAVSAAAADPARTTASRLAKDFAVSADPHSALWKKVAPVNAAVDPFGKPAANKFTFRVAWTPENLYFHFECPYDTLTLKPNPDAAGETNKLWEWDVTEVFIGADFNNIGRYREVQVSPQGEWVDLDIDRKAMNGDKAVLWNSGMKVAAHIDRDKKIWYGAMKIPMAAIDERPAKAGSEFRMNVYRLAGATPNRQSIMWTPTNNRSHHTPEAFGILTLGK